MVGWFQSAGWPPALQVKHLTLPHSVLLELIACSEGTSHLSPGGQQRRGPPQVTGWCGLLLDT